MLHHFANNQDVRVVNRFYTALSKGTRRAAMAAWMLNCMAVSANADKATKDESPFKFSKDKATRVPVGLAKPWYDFKPDAKPDEIYDFKGAIESVLRKVANAKAGVHQCSQDALDQIADAVGVKRIRLPKGPDDFATGETKTQVQELAQDAGAGADASEEVPALV